MNVCTANPDCSRCSFLNLAILCSKDPRDLTFTSISHVCTIHIDKHTHTHTQSNVSVYDAMPRRNVKRRSRIIFISTRGDMRVGVSVGGRNNTNTPRGRYAVIKNSPRPPGWFMHATLPQETHTQVARTLAFRWCDRPGRLYFSYISHRAVYIID